MLLLLQLRTPKSNKKKQGLSSFLRELTVYLQSSCQGAIVFNCRVNDIETLPQTLAAVERTRSTGAFVVTPSEVQPRKKTRSSVSGCLVSDSSQPGNRAHIPKSADVITDNPMQRYHSQGPAVQNTTHQTPMGQQTHPLAQARARIKVCTSCILHRERGISPQTGCRLQPVAQSRGPSLARICSD